uniref:SAM domain-containing protein n=1 Tax=Takifugu rubripes TaxID=31033 RepID=A0A674P557_TAKRU
MWFLRLSCWTTVSRRAAPSCPSPCTNTASRSPVAMTTFAQWRPTTAWERGAVHHRLLVTLLLIPCCWRETPPFSFEALLGRPVGSPEDQEGALVAPGRGRYHQLTNSSSQETLSSPSSSPSKPRPSAECSLLDRRSRRPESEVLVSDWTQDGPGEPDVPSVVLDTQTRRRFLDLGVTLRRSYIRVTKEKSTRLSGEPSESPSRSSGSPVTFSWFSEGRGHCPSCSSKLSPLSSPRHQKPHSQWSADLQDFSCPHLSSSPPQRDACRSSQPYHTLSEEVWEEPLSPMSSWTTQQVCQWLKGLNLEQYVPEFSANEVDGRQLLQMDGKALKGLGVLSASDRAALKRRIKEVQSAAEKQRKAVEKMEKQRRRKQEQCSN